MAEPPPAPLWDIFAEGPGGVVLKTTIAAESADRAEELATLKVHKWEPVDESDLPSDWPPPDSE